MSGSVNVFIEAAVVGFNVSTGDQAEDSCLPLKMRLSLDIWEGCLHGVESLFSAEG